MATDAQIIANRINAKKSTGPRSPQGKDLVSKNAVKHGFCARQDIISSESRPNFELYREKILEELAPASPMESILAERIVSLSWRLKRAARIHNQTIDALNTPDTSGPLARLTKALVFKVQNLPHDDTSESAHNLALGRLAIKDFSDARVLERLLMYERRIEHSLFKTMLEFQKLNLIKKLSMGL